MVADPQAAASGGRADFGVMSEAEAEDEQGAWAIGLAEWYAANGRHDVPWRTAADPWAILVSEVMLQQTPVQRVLPRWQRFLDRWPTPAACADAAVDDVLREWQGLGYPRRALALHRSAAMIARDGWPTTEVALRALPGVGTYTARALLAFAFGHNDGGPPRDVNLQRVVARAALGVEPHAARPRVADQLLDEGRGTHMTMRDYAYALFDLGALVCTARAPRCATCPLAARCASRARLDGTVPTPPPRRQPRFRGSVRELRGAVLRAYLSAEPPASTAELHARIAAEHIDADVARVAAAREALIREGLLAG